MPDGEDIRYFLFFEVWWDFAIQKDVFMLKEKKVLFFTSKVKYFNQETLQHPFRIPLKTGQINKEVCARTF